MKHAVPCAGCRGTGHLPCDVCRGRGIVRARAPRTMKQLLEEARSKAGGGAPPPPAVDLICPACGCTMEQRCLNCLGIGKVCLPN